MPQNNRATGARQCFKLSIVRSGSGRLLSVNVPIVSPTDPEWYQSAALAAGYGPANTYSVDAWRFLTTGRGQLKIGKSDKRSSRYRSAVLHLAPHVMSGFSVCQQAHGCASVCVNFNGKGQLANGAWRGETQQAQRVALVSHALRHTVHRARIAKTRLFHVAPELFAECIEQSLGRFVRTCARSGMRPLVRPNCTSYIPWERYRPDRWCGLTLFERFPVVQFYDYTKLFYRASGFARGCMPTNYDLTFSRDETNGARVEKLLTMGGRVAVVVRTRDMVDTWGAPLAKLGKRAVQLAIRNGIPGIDNRFPRVDGDADDIRHKQPQPGIVVLSAKGRAARDSSGFAIDLN